MYVLFCSKTYHFSHSLQCAHCQFSTYSVQRGIHVLEGTQRVSDSVKKGHMSSYPLQIMKLYSDKCYGTYRCFTNRVCMKSAEVALIVDWKSFQEIGLLESKGHIRKKWFGVGVHLRLLL